MLNYKSLLHHTLQFVVFFAEVSSYCC